MNIDILHPEIFPKDKIIAGLTKKNPQIAEGRGLSFSPAEVHTLTEIEEHKKLLADFLEIKPEELKFQHQVHSKRVRVIALDTNEEDADGLITNEKGLVISVKVADCAAILLYDPVHEAIGAIHSGWRGTRQNICSYGIDKMRKEYASRPKDLLAFVSPCASGRNYEVGYDVAKFFPETSVKVRKEKYLFDNKKEILTQLLDAGVRKKNIEISPICTIEDEDFHSFRRDGDKSGRMAAYIGFK